jgi:lipopolysaccharide biosynthesis glycosyltransferase
MSHLNAVASQFYTLGLTQYDVVVYVDVDTLVLRNVDDDIVGFARSGAYFSAVDEDRARWHD